jgi:hypothetical protein
MRTIKPYLITIAWRPDGSLVAQHEQREIVSDPETGEALVERVIPAHPLPLPLAEEILGEVNATLLAENANLRSTDARRIARIAELEAELAEARKAPAPPSAPGQSDDLLSALATHFEALPIEIQSAFALAFATVRVLVQAGRPDLAAAFLRDSVPVPAELEETKAAIIATLE